MNQGSGMHPTATFTRLERSETPPSGGPKAVRAWLLGGFWVSVGSQTIEQDQWRLRKAASLVKLLAIAPGHRIHREQVMNLLWPDLGRKTASNNLEYSCDDTHVVLPAVRRAQLDALTLARWTWLTQISASGLRRIHSTASLGVVSLNGVAFGPLPTAFGAS